MSASFLEAVADRAAIMAIDFKRTQPLVCAKCGAVFRTRNAMFKHLRTTCLPAVASLDVPKPDHPRVVLCVGYVGHEWYGLSASGADDETIRPSIAGAIVSAAKRAWGDSVVTGATSEAVRTEKGASAHGNILVLTMQRGHTGDMDGEQLRRELPPTIWLLGEPRAAPPAEHGVELFKQVRQQVHTFAVPYSVLTCQSLLADDQRGDEHAKRICLIGLPEGCTAADVLDLLRSVAHIHGSPTLAYSDDDGHLVRSRSPLGSKDCASRFHVSATIDCGAAECLAIWCSLVFGMAEYELW